MKYTEKQKGSLYMTIVLLGLILAVAIAATGIVVSGSNLTKGLGDSLRAFHIADSGIEEFLYRLRIKNEQPSEFNCSFDFENYGTTSCNVVITTGEETSIKAVGSYNGSKRRIESAY